MYSGSSNNGPSERSTHTCSNNLSTIKGHSAHFPILLIHFEPLKNIKPLYKGQNGWPQRIQRLYCISCYYYNTDP